MWWAHWQGSVLQEQLSSNVIERRPERYGVTVPLGYGIMLKNIWDVPSLKQHLNWIQPIQAPASAPY